MPCVLPSAAVDDLFPAIGNAHPECVQRLVVPIGIELIHLSDQATAVSAAVTQILASLRAAEPTLDSSDIAMS